MAEVTENPFLPLLKFDQSGDGDCEGHDECKPKLTWFDGEAFDDYGYRAHVQYEPGNLCTVGKRTHGIRLIGAPCTNGLPICQYRCDEGMRRTYLTYVRCGHREGLPPQAKKPSELFYSVFPFHSVFIEDRRS